eukprot:352766-Chlamydomonas_euryale.AAC.1
MTAPVTSRKIHLARWPQGSCTPLGGPEEAAMDCIRSNRACTRTQCDDTLACVKAALSFLRVLAFLRILRLRGWGQPSCDLDPL